MQSKLYGQLQLFQLDLTENIAKATGGVDLELYALPAKNTVPIPERIVKVILRSFTAPETFLYIAEFLGANSGFNTRVNMKTALIIV